ncbi:hypothetical protein KKF55_05145 [Patescibacteria group bacterium]|nr:hypothetical protein [Patescibacteria group bacterium]
MTNRGSASGKIILTGEYAVVFGFSGIAIPSPLRMDVTFEEDRSFDAISINWEGAKTDDQWNAYLQDILNAIQKFKGKLFQGRLKITNELPLGKGMGSSTSLVIAVSRCLLGAEYRTEALAIEDKMNTGHSGIDFNVIWEEKPLLFKKGEEPQEIDLPEDILKNAVLIDTGKPNETTAELVEYISLRRIGDSKITDALEKIGQCTDRLIKGEPLQKILPDHHRAQVALGIVPEEVQKLIEEIEDIGGAAKVLGAGAKTGGGGMVLAIGIDAHKIPQNFRVISLEVAV